MSMRPVLMASDAVCCRHGNFSLPGPAQGADIPRLLAKEHARGERRSTRRMQFSRFTSRYRCQQLRLLPDMDPWVRAVRAGKGETLKGALGNDPETEKKRHRGVVVAMSGGAIVATSGAGVAAAAQHRVLAQPRQLPGARPLLLLLRGGPMLSAAAACQPAGAGGWLNAVSVAATAVDSTDALQRRQLLRQLLPLQLLRLHMPVVLK